MEAKDLPMIRGELENFAKDVIEYYQKTCLVYPPSLSTTAKRIAEISFKAGREGICSNLAKFLDGMWCVSNVGDTEEDAERFIKALVKVGRREVVEWAEQHGEEYQDAEPEAHYYGEVYWQVPLCEWQAFKESKGIQKEN